mmetsp:Transcript_17807/g.67223  ORF Transcript_17807/g.67223 Transcript_17807/m.67223 type:complete len:351 (-) Transcript_17807:185-1237(-)
MAPGRAGDASGVGGRASEPCRGPGLAAPSLAAAAFQTEEVGAADADAWPRDSRGEAPSFPAADAPAAPALPIPRDLIAAPRRAAVFTRRTDRRKDAAGSCPSPTMAPPASGPGSAASRALCFRSRNDRAMATSRAATSGEMPAVRSPAAALRLFARRAPKPPMPSANTARARRTMRPTRASRWPLPSLSRVTVAMREAASAPSESTFHPSASSPRSLAAASSASALARAMAVREVWRADRASLLSSIARRATARLREASSWRRSTVDMSLPTSASWEIRRCFFRMSLRSRVRVRMREAHSFSPSATASWYAVRSSFERRSVSAPRRTRYCTTSGRLWYTAMWRAVCPMAS